MRKIYYEFVKNHTIKDKYKIFELTNKFSKFLLKEFINIPIMHIQFLKLNYFLFLKYSKYKERCLISNRSRALIKKYMLSRMVFKKLALNGYIVGVQKASW